MKKASKNTIEKKTKKKISKKTSNLVKVKVTQKMLLRDMKVALAGQIIEVDNEYAKILQEKLGFIIQK